MLLLCQRLNQYQPAIHIHHFLSNAIGGVGSKGKVMCIHCLEMPGFGGTRCDGYNGGRCRAPWFIGKVADIQLAAEACRHGFLGINQCSCCAYNVVIREGESHIETAKVAIELLSQMLVGGPAKLLIVDADARVPVHTIVMLGTSIFKQLHSSAQTANIEVSREIY